MSYEAPAESPTSDAIVEAVGLTKYYGSFVAIQDVSFTIGRGSVVALLGPNGAGKTTTIKILAGFIAPSAGTARIAGFDVQADRLQAASRVGYLPENGPLYPDMTPFELLRFFGAARGLSMDELESRIATVIDQCALSGVAEKSIGKLSKGLRQRVGLAHALLHDPGVLILDEPTAGLDPNQIRDFRNHVNRLRGSKTFLISTHILHEVPSIADRLLLIHEGRLVYDDVPAAMMDGGSLERGFYRLAGNTGVRRERPAS